MKSILLLTRNLAIGILVLSPATGLGFNSYDANTTITVPAINCASTLSAGASDQEISISFDLSNANSSGSESRDIKFIGDSTWDYELCIYKVSLQSVDLETAFEPLLDIEMPAQTFDSTSEEANGSLKLDWSNLSQLSSLLSSEGSSLEISMVFEVTTLNNDSGGI